MTEKTLHDLTVVPPKVAVLHVELPQEELSLRTMDDKLAEAVNLFQALEVEVGWQQCRRLNRCSAHTLLGKGQVAETAEALKAVEAEAVLVNTTLSPAQQRNLEREWGVKVLDRTGVILEIFAQRARTKAGRLQVALAQIQYQQSRLVRSWTHLERQRGGLGKTGGPGERQIELDRRMLLDRATELRKRLQHVQQERQVQRQARRRHAMPQVALVGYTNAGKSTLFEALTGHAAGSEDKLFATLDPLVRKLTLPSGREVALSDTVGFVADLPHELVAAFKATLEEVAEADLILQVHDAANPEAVAQAQDVTAVLAQIEAEEIPTIQIANKVDLLAEGAGLAIAGLSCSAVQQTGLAEIMAQIEAFFAAQEKVEQLTVPAEDGQRLAWLHQHATVQQRTLEDGMWHLTVQFTSENQARYRQKWPD